MLKKICVIGLGLIGASLAAAFKRKKIAACITGISSDTTIAKGNELSLIDEGFTYEHLQDGIHDAEIIFLCSPISRIIELLPDVISYASPGTLITDVGSTKREIMEVAQKHKKKNVSFIGGHPMAGSERQGIEAYDPFLFENAICILTPFSDTNREHFGILKNCYTTIGAEIISLDPRAHDHIVATISHLPQLLAVSLVNMMNQENSNDPQFIQLAAGGFRDMTRIASSPFNMWKDICETNRDLIIDQIEKFSEYLSQIKGNFDLPNLEIEFKKAHITRDLIPKDTKGIIHPLSEILVTTEDKPGMLAKMAGALADDQININDIEVLKIREGEGGSIRIAVENIMLAKKAVQTLQKAGFQARHRE